MFLTFQTHLWLPAVMSYTDFNVKEESVKDIWAGYSSRMRFALTLGSTMQVASTMIDGNSISNVILREFLLLVVTLYNLIFFWRIEPQRQAYVKAIDNPKKMRNFFNLGEDHPLLHFIFGMESPSMGHVKTIHVTDDADKSLKTPVHVFSKKKPSADGPGCILYIHGGGMVACSTKTHEDHIRTLASLTNLPVLSIDYRLAPEVAYPTCVDDCWTVYKWLLAHGSEHGISTKKIVITGDSAGAAIAASVTVRAIMENNRAPDGCLFTYIWSAGPEFPSHKRFANDVLLPKQILDMGKIAVKEGLKKTKRTDYSPYDASDDIIKQFPPCLLYVGDRDPLLDDSRFIHDKFTKCGVDSTLHVLPGLTHGFANVASFIPKAKEVNKEASTWIKNICQ